MLSLFRPSESFNFFSIDKMPLQIPDCFYRVATKALVTDETGVRFLLFLQQDGDWSFPGGGLDFWESPHEGLAREIKEESGLSVKWIASSPRYACPAEWKEGIWTFQLFYPVELENLDFSPSEECQAIKFFSPQEMKTLPRTMVVDHFITQYFADENH